MPHLTVDPVVAASAVVNSLQHLVSRVTNPTQGAVISVTRFNTGAVILQQSFASAVARVYVNTQYSGHIGHISSSLNLELDCKSSSKRQTYIGLHGTGEGATNVIPDEVKLGGTLRALNIPQFRALEVRATQVRPSCNHGRW